MLIADHALVIGEGDTIEEAFESHDQKFIDMLERCRQRNLTLHPKMYFCRTEVPFVGHILTSDSLKMQPVKGTAAVSLRALENISAVRRFLGMANYVSCFIPKLSETVTPLRQLTRKETDWKWEAEHQQAFKKIRSCLIEPPVLHFLRRRTTDKVTT